MEKGKDTNDGKGQIGGGGGAGKRGSFWGEKIWGRKVRTRQNHTPLLLRNCIMRLAKAKGKNKGQ